MARMQSITASILVECSVEAVFAFVTDARNNLLWQSTSGLRESRQLPESPVGVGTQVIEIWHVMGVRALVTSEVTAYEPGRCYTRHRLSGACPITQRTQLFEPAANGTRWISSLSIQAGGEYAIDETALAIEIEQALKANLAVAKTLLERRIVQNAH